MNTAILPFPDPVPFELPTQPRGLTIREVVQLYLRHCQADGVHCAEARATRERTFKLFIALHGRLVVSDAKPYHLTDFIEDRPSWKSVSTRRGKANEIRAAFEWAAREQRIPANPFASVRYAEAERRPCMPDQVIADIETTANIRFAAVVAFKRYTMARVSELSEARWRDVDLDKALWTIHRHKSRRYTGKPKIVPLIAEAVELLRELRYPEVADDDHIFLNNRNTPWNRRTLGQHLRRMKVAGKISTAATLHGIRHQAATQAVANGAPLKFVSLMLGHASTAITERYYVHVDGQVDAIRQAAELSMGKPAATAPGDKAPS